MKLGNNSVCGPNPITAPKIPVTAEPRSSGISPNFFIPKYITFPRITSDLGAQILPHKANNFPASVWLSRGLFLLSQRGGWHL